jgi:hypothetical protein
VTNIRTDSQCRVSTGRKSQLAPQAVSPWADGLVPVDRQAGPLPAAVFYQRLIEGAIGLGKCWSARRSEHLERGPSRAASLAT